MNYELSDKEYAVLDYIRKRQGTHIDHLYIVFGPDTLQAVTNLEKYGLIDSNFPNRDIYSATELGQSRKHKINHSNVDSQTAQVKKSASKKHSSHSFFYYLVGISTVAGAIIALATLIVSIKSCT